MPPKRAADGAMAKWAKQNKEKRLAEEARKEHNKALKRKPLKRKDGLTQDEYRIKRFVAREEARLAGTLTKQHDIDSEYGKELSSPIQEEWDIIERRLRANEKAKDEKEKKPAVEEEKEDEVESDPEAGEVSEQVLEILGKAAGNGNGNADAVIRLPKASQSARLS